MKRWLRLANAPRRRWEREVTLSHGASGAAGAELLQPGPYARISAFRRSRASADGSELGKLGRDRVSSLVQTDLAKDFVLPQLMQSLAGDLTRPISWIALGNLILPGAALVRSLPCGRGGSECVLAPTPGSRPCRMTKRAESEEGKKRSGRAEWQLRPSSALGRDLFKEPSWRR